MEPDYAADVFVPSSRGKRKIAVSRQSKCLLVTALLAGTAQGGPLPSTSATRTYHRVQADGVGISYQEAGPENASTIVLLHGFPSSSREFDTIIPLLTTKYHLIAPDYPGFGISDAPSPAAYTYTFDRLAQTINDLLERQKVTHYTLYLHDYGAPIGFRIVLAHPDRLDALIIQNGNIYKAGLGAKWAKIAEYWANQKAHPEVLNALLSFEATKERHIAGTSHPDRYDPDTWMREYADLSRPNQREIQADFSTIIGTTSRRTRNGRPGSANISRTPSWSGRKGSFLHRAGCRSLQTGFTESGNPPARRWALRTG